MIAPILAAFTRDEKRYEENIRRLRVRALLTLALVVASATLPTFACICLVVTLGYLMQRQISAFNALDKISTETKKGYREEPREVTFWGLISFRRYELCVQENESLRIQGSI